MKPRLVIVFEEPQNLIGRSTDSAHASETNADPKAFATQEFVLALAQLRGERIGIIGVTPLPSAMPDAFFSATVTKEVYRLLNSNDREAAARNIMMEDGEVDELGRLRQFEAYLYTDGMHRAVRISTPHPVDDLELPLPAQNDAILPLISGDAWFQTDRAARVTDEMRQLGKALAVFENSRAGLNAQAARLRAECFRAMACLPQERANKTAALRRRIRALRDRLDESFRSFVRDAYRPLMGNSERLDIPEGALRSARDSIVKQFRDEVQPGVKGCLAILDGLLRKSGAAKPKQGKETGHAAKR